MATGKKLFRGDSRMGYGEWQMGQRAWGERSTEPAGGYPDYGGQPRQAKRKLQKTNHAKSSSRFYIENEAVNIVNQDHQNWRPRVRQEAGRNDVKNDDKNDKR
jgi:hypothetical protein